LPLPCEILELTYPGYIVAGKRWLFQLLPFFLRVTFSFVLRITFLFCLIFTCAFDYEKANVKIRIPASLAFVRTPIFYIMNDLLATVSRQQGKKAKRQRLKIRSHKPSPPPSSATAAAVNNSCHY